MKIVYILGAIGNFFAATSFFCSKNYYAATWVIVASIWMFNSYIKEKKYL